MIEVSDYTKDIFSMLSNLCFPTINHVIKGDLIQFINNVEMVLDEKELDYLIQVLIPFNLSQLETKHDKLNINLVEFTYALYEVWMEYIEEELPDVVLFNNHIDKEFIEATNEALFTCLLNQDVLLVYHKLNTLEKVKEKLIETKIIKKYQDNVIKNIKKDSEDMSTRIKHVFKVLDEYLNHLDADLYLFEFIEDYEQYCLVIIETIDKFDEIIKSSKEKYLQTCVEIFGPRVAALYKEIESRYLQIDTLNLKIHILKFLQQVINID